MCFLLPRTVSRLFTCSCDRPIDSTAKRPVFWQLMTWSSNQSHIAVNSRSSSNLLCSLCELHNLNRTVTHTFASKCSDVVLYPEHLFLFHLWFSFLPGWSRTVMFHNVMCHRNVLLDITVAFVCYEAINVRKIIQSTYRCTLNYFRLDYIHPNESFFSPTGEQEQSTEGKWGTGRKYKNLGWHSHLSVGGNEVERSFPNFAHVLLLATK